MNRKIRVDAAGRIVLPQPVRKQFHLERGSVLKLEVEEDAIILRPQTEEARLVEEDGLLVHEGEPSGDLMNVVETSRQRRDRDTAGPLK